jgi:hypothetical protein
VIKCLILCTEGERLFNRPECRCEDGILVDGKAETSKDVERINLAQDR